MNTPERMGEENSSLEDIPQPMIKIIPMNQLTMPGSSSSNVEDDEASNLSEDGKDDDEVVVLDVKPKPRKINIVFNNTARSNTHATVKTVTKNPTFVPASDHRNRLPNHDQPDEPIKETGVNCLLCYRPGVNYNTNKPRYRRKILGTTSIRLLNYICTHLEIESLPSEVIGPIKNNTIPKEQRLIPANLPLCTKCSANYYGDLYDAFTAFENAMAKLLGKVSSCVTNVIADSAKRNNQSTQSFESGTCNNTGAAVRISKIKTKTDPEIKEHEVMKSVKHFRQKIVDRNPAGLVCEAPLEHEEGTESLAPNEVAEEGRPTPVRISNVTPDASTGLTKAIKIVSTSSLRKGNEIFSDQFGSASLLSKDKPFNYYAVNKPSKGVIQIIPVVLDKTNAKSTPLPSNTDLKLHRIKRGGARSDEQRIIQTTCKFCSKIFSNRHQLLRHQVQIHGMEKPEKCSQCNYKGISKADLRSHRETHLNECEKTRKFICEICHKSFRSKGGLQNHLRMHRGEKPFICDVCGKQFASDKSMKYCLDKHQGIKHHQCPHCPNQFLRKEVLKIHIRTHTGEKPFACHLCPKRFAQRAPLNTHLRYHLKLDPCADIKKPKSFFVKREKQ